MTALVPYGGRSTAPRPGERTVAQFASNGVAADVRVERADARNRCCWYAIKLASSESDATGRLVGVRRGGAVDELGSVEVMPRSVGSGRFAVTAPRTGAYAAMYLEVWSGEMLLRVEAPLPPAPRGSRALRAGALLVALGAAAACAGTMPLAFARDAERAVPAAAPRKAAATSTASASAPAAPARVMSFSARRDDAPGGETVLASYLAAGDRGTIALLGPDGTVVTSGAFARVGTIRLRVPAAFRALPLTAQITVRRGATKAVSTVLVAANAQATPPPSAAPDPASAAPGRAGDGGPASNGAASALAPGIVAVEGAAVAGRPLTLRIAPQSSPMRVQLEDAAGGVIAERDIAPGATRALVPLPPSQARASYLLALHYTRNGGEETVIRTVVATPR